jgi:hypothetical protein
LTYEEKTGEEKKTDFEGVGRGQEWREPTKKGALSLFTRFQPRFPSLVYLVEFSPLLWCLKTA